MAHSSTPLSSVLNSILSQIPADSPLLVEYLFQTAMVLFDRYKEKQDPEYLQEAIVLADRAIDGLTMRDSDDPALGSWLNNYSHMLELQYDRTEDLATLDMAIAQSLRAADFDSDKSLQIVYLSDLGCLQEKKFDKARDKEALDAAIDAAKKSVNMATDSSEIFATLLYNLAVKIFKRFRETDEEHLDQLDEAIQLQSRALQALDDQDGHPWLHFKNMRAMLEARYQHTSTPKDLDRALFYAERLVNECAADSSMFPHVLNEIAGVLHLRYIRDGEESDLDSAIGHVQDAIKLLREQSGLRGECFELLGILLGKKFEASGKLEIIEDAVTAARNATETSRATDEHCARCLNTLGNLLSLRFEGTGSMEDLDEAIRTSRNALELSVNASRGSLSARFSALADKLDKRYERIGTIDDLNEAIFKTKEALDLDQFDSRKSKIFTNLGNFEEKKFERYREVIHVKIACEYATKAVELAEASGDDKYFLSASYHNLGNKLARLFSSTGDIEKLVEAVDYAEKAVANTPATHPDNLLFLNSLSNHLQSLYRITVHNQQGRDQNTDGKDILERAIRAAQRAIALAGLDDPREALCWSNLARSYSNCPEDHFRDLEMQALMKAWNCHNGPPFQRISVVRRLLRLLGAKGAWNQAVDTVKEAIKLLSAVNPRYLAYDDQQHAVSHFGGLSADACSLILQKGDRPYEALDILEKGRATILGMLIDSRSDTSKLATDHPELAGRYELLRAEVSAPVSKTQDLATRKTHFLRRQRAAEDLDALIGSIRQLSGYSHFLLGLSEAVISEQASKGPIVIINVTDFRSDAIIVSHKIDIQTIPLPGLTAFEVKRWLRKDLMSFKREEFRQKNKSFVKFMVFLWTECVKLVIDTIKNAKVCNDDTLRIWWIGTGLASSLPFHAAGDHSVGSIDNTISQAICSYTPTIKVLGYTRESKIDPFPSIPKLLLVSMQTTPGQTPLPGVAREIKALSSVLANNWLLKLEHQPDSKTVLQGLHECEIVHFACHGYSDSQNPAKSHLMLQKQGEADASPIEDPLTLQAIIEMGLKKSWIAYLSACSTADNTSQRLADEVLHIASGFQVSGFKHVIASMWPAPDEVCVAVAQEFYQTIEKDRRTSSSDDIVARALHRSVELVRDGLRRQPLAWAQFIHYGM